MLVKSSTKADSFLSVDELRMINKYAVVKNTKELLVKKSESEMTWIKT